MRSQDPEIQKLIFTAEQSTRIEQALVDMSDSQISWLGGYLTGLAAKPGALKSIGGVLSSDPSQRSNDADLKSGQNKAALKVLVLFGSQTGNAQSAAQLLFDSLLEQGVNAELADMAKFKGKKLEQFQQAYIVISTYGDGEPPESAENFHHWIHSAKAKQLPHLEFAVFGLGDSTYEFFCKTAKDFHQAMLKLSATPIHEPVLCDVDYKDHFNSWSKTITQHVIKSDDLPAKDITPNQNTTVLDTNPSTVNAEVSHLVKLTTEESPKRIYHIEYEIDPETVNYQPGDAVAVLHKNPDSLVNDAIEVFNAGDPDIVWKNSTLKLSAALTSQIELTQIHPQLVEYLAQHTNDKHLIELTKDKSALFAWIKDKQIPELIKEYAQGIELQQLIAQLRPLKERLYSIASSQAANSDELHLTVAHVIDHQKSQFNQGSASTAITQASESDLVEIEIRPNQHFRLPSDPNTPIIMIGPGTGIAPFRAFLQHREYERSVNKSIGDNWLFFGNTHFQWDFLYQTELQDWVKSGLLTRLSLAFSRDQTQKIYVQDRLREEAESIFQWIEKGAHLYICGDKNRMAKDVEQTLINIIQQVGDFDTEQANAYFRELKAQGRLQKDVY